MIVVWYLCLCIKIGSSKDQYKFVHNAATTALNWHRTSTRAKNYEKLTVATNDESIYYNVRPNPESLACDDGNTELNIYVNTAAGPGCSGDHSYAKLDGQNLYENFWGDEGFDHTWENSVVRETLIARNAIRHKQCRCILSRIYRLMRLNDELKLVSFSGGGR